MVRIAVIQKNKCNLDMEKYVVPLLYRYLDKDEKKFLRQQLDEFIWKEIEQYISFIDTDDVLSTACSMMTECYSNRVPDNFYYHTEGSYSFPKKFLEILFCRPTWKEYERSLPENMNNIGCLFSLKHTVIENTCIIISNKYDVNAQQNVVIDSVTKEDILKVIRRRYFFSAILLEQNSSKKYYYQEPKYLISTVFKIAEHENIGHMPVSFLGYNLVFYFLPNLPKETGKNLLTDRVIVKSESEDRVIVKSESEDKDDDVNTSQTLDLPINQIATRINGFHRIYGNVLVLHELDNNVYGNLSHREIKRINVLSFGRLYDRQLKDDELESVDSKEYIPKEYLSDEDNNKKTVPYRCRYITIEKRMVKFREHGISCANCSRSDCRLFVCGKCYRVKFCSDSCQTVFVNNYHRDECFS